MGSVVVAASSVMADRWVPRSLGSVDRVLGGSDHADVFAGGVVEPLRVKTQAITSAQEAAQLLLRIDDVVAAGNLSSIEEDDGEADF